MKKLLLATTALFAAGLVAAPAQANLEVTVGGFVAFQAAMFDNDTTNNSDRDFQSESEILVSAAATADNGLQYGAKVLLDASTSDTSNADETSIYLAGAWGRVELGDDDGASEMAVFAPTVGLGQINGSYDDYVPLFDRGGDLNDRGSHTFTAVDSGDSTKVTYYTPKFSGFQAGVSYAPELNQGENVVFSDTASTLQDIFELGLGYDGEFSGVQVKVAGIYTTGEANTGFEDMSAWTLGAQLGYNGFRFGGSYTDNGDSLNSTGFGNDDYTTWTVGATYENGPWGVGLSYLNADFGGNGDIGSQFGSDGNAGDYSAWALGGTYTVAPGLTVGADLAFYDRNRAVTTDTDGYVFVTDVTAAF